MAEAVHLPWVPPVSGHEPDVAATALVRPGTDIPAGSFVAGVPAKLRPLSDDHMAEMIVAATREYRCLAALHRGIWS